MTKKDSLVLSQDLPSSAGHSLPSPDPSGPACNMAKAYQTAPTRSVGRNIFLGSEQNKRTDCDGGMTYRVDGVLCCRRRRLCFGLEELKHFNEPD